jgi:hypothetical protein
LVSSNFVAAAVEIAGQSSATMHVAFRQRTDADLEAIDAAVFELDGRFHLESSLLVAEARPPEWAHPPFRLTFAGTPRRVGR